MGLSIHMGKLAKSGKMIDLIHIGDYKTGTSWWQSQALPSHPEIYYLDNPHVHPEVVHLMHRLVDSRDLDFDADSLREKFSGILEGLDCKGQRRLSAVKFFQAHILPVIMPGEPQNGCMQYLGR